MNFLDTNILLYSISRGSAEVAKRDTALELLDNVENALSTQVLQEFYVQATRASKSDPISHEIAVALIEGWTRFRIQEISLSVVQGALDIRKRFGFSYWDSAIVSAAKTIGCANLYTEDLQHGREIDGVKIVNPFHAIN